MKNAFVTAAMAGLLIMAAPLAGHAQPAVIQLEAVGMTSRAQLAWKQWEWFARELEQRTKGRVKMRVRTFPELGLTGFEMIRTMKAGLLDIGDVQPSYISGDLPIVEGQDVPGIYKTLEDWRDGHIAWGAVLQKYENQMGGKYLGSYSFAINVLYSRKPIAAIADLKGMKVRTFGTVFPTYLKALGAQPVVIPFAEAYTAMEQGAVDAIQTTIEVGLALKLGEISKYIIDLQLGSGPGTLVVGQPTWNKLPADVREIMIQLGKEFTDRSWSDAIQASRSLINEHEKAGVKYIGVRDTWNPQLQAASKAVLADWLKRSGKPGADAFNQYLAPITGFTVQAP